MKLASLGTFRRDYFLDLFLKLNLTYRQVLGMDAFKLYFKIVTINSTDPSANYIETSNGEWITSWITSSFLFACIVGAGIFSVVSDTLGRKFSIIIGETSKLFGFIVQTHSL
jgi:MFS family permease